MRLCTDDNALYTLIPMTNNPLCHCEPFFNCHCEPKAWQSRRGVRLLRRPSTDGLPRNDRGRGVIAVSQSPECSEGEAKQSHENKILNTKSEILNNIK